MWYFQTPRIVYGDGALAELANLEAERAFIVTDREIERLGFLLMVEEALDSAGIAHAAFSDVKTDPDTQTARRCADEMLKFQPDLVIGLGGGSCLDASKAAWILYERPDTDLESVTPFERYGLRGKARLVTIPTTAGSGAEITAAAVISADDFVRKMEVASFELVPDLAIVDPKFSAHMPKQLTADSGIDVLTHAVEGYTSTFSNDFSDSLCLHAAKMVFEYLPRAYKHGASDMEARQKMAYASTIAALGMGNSHIALAHGLGHSLGAVFSLPHGRVTGLLLSYTIEFTANTGMGRYRDFTNTLGIETENEEQAAFRFAEAIRDLLKQIDQPSTLQEAGITSEGLRTNLELLCDLAQMDSSLATSLRFPYREDLEKLFQYAFDGKKIDF